MAHAYRGGRNSTRSRATGGDATSFRRHAREATTRRQRWEKQERLAQFDSALRDELPRAIASEPTTELSQRIGNSRNTVLGWQQGNYLPHLTEAFVLAAEHPEVKALFLRLLMVGPNTAEGADLAQAIAKYLQAYRNE